jgi:hypothetical protein
MPADLTRLAELLHDHNRVDNEIARLIDRPAEKGHIGEFIAAAIFDIALHESATHKGSDGSFRSGPLAGRTVDVKCYGKQEWILAISEAGVPDYYLVLTGPHDGAMISRGQTRPFAVDKVYLFQAPVLIAELLARGVKLSVATSVRREHWDRAEIYPNDRSPLLQLTPEQREMLALFSADRIGR